MDDDATRPGVAWFDSEVFDRHEMGPGHPEGPARLRAVREGVEARNLTRSLERVAPEPAPVDLVAEVHAREYLAALEELDRRGGGVLDPDTSMNEASHAAAFLAAGAVVGAVDGVLAGRWRRAFCSVRPPGHHARPGRAMGFCFLDNVAIGAQAALRHGGVERVAILDWDVHHGNGTQEIFWDRGDVLFASTHQFPFYPGTGSPDEVGAGAGEGKTLNCPLASGAGDAALLRAWREVLRPAFEDFAPDLVLVSAGFDADARDPLAGLRITAAGFETLSAEVVEFAEQACGGRLVSVLEGGYALDALAEDVALHLETMV